MTLPTVTHDPADRPNEGVPVTMSDQTEPTYTDRGFAHMEAVPSEYGGSVRAEMSDSKVNYPEPPDGSIVGFGEPIEAAYVRLDGYAEGYHEDERWHEVDDISDDDPLCWLALLRSQSGLKPYLLVPTPIEAQR